MPGAPKHIWIIGGGPAGLAASIALSQAGFRTTVLDCATPPIDKACGEGLLPDCISALTQLGVTLPPGCGYTFYGIQFSDGHSKVAAHFPTGYAVGLRRTVLHQLLTQRATELGVEMRWGVRSTGLFDCDLVVGADGGNSAVRREAGLSATRTEAHRYGFRQHFALAPWSDYMQVHWSHRSQLYITPISHREVGIAVVSSDAKLRLSESLLGDFPEVGERLRSAEPLSTERGSLSTMRRLRAVHNGRVVLVGDASGSVDVITGEGVGVAFRQALALARSLKSGGLASYSIAHNAICRRPRLMARLLLALGANPNLRRPALAGLAICPRVFSSLLAFHVGGSL